MRSKDHKRKPPKSVKEVFDGPQLTRTEAESDDNMKFFHTDSIPNAALMRRAPLGNELDTIRRSLTQVKGEHNEFYIRTLNNLVKIARDEHDRLQVTFHTLKDG